MSLALEQKWLPGFRALAATCAAGALTADDHRTLVEHACCSADLETLGVALEFSPADLSGVALVKAARRNHSHLMRALTQNPKCEQSREVSIDRLCDAALPFGAMKSMVIAVFGINHDQKSSLGAWAAAKPLLPWHLREKLSLALVGKYKFSRREMDTRNLWTATRRAVAMCDTRGADWALKSRSGVDAPVQHQAALQSYAGLTDKDAQNMDFWMRENIPGFVPR